eukprot:Hpha_TRINITY_DN16883_c0_g5::TRINITY_DN16883_c0_g5_i1::g.149006::m.149006
MPLVLLLLAGFTLTTMTTGRTTVTPTSTQMMTSSATLELISVFMEDHALPFIVILLGLVVVYLSVALALGTLHGVARLCRTHPRFRSIQRHHLLVTLAFYPVLSILSMLPAASETQAPTVRPPFCTVKTLYVTGRQTCVMDWDGMLRCWGENEDWQGVSNC